MVRRHFSNVKELYLTLKSERAEYLPLWEEISKYVGIRVDPQYLYAHQTHSKSRFLDFLVDDPTASLSVNQAGDYLQGVVWGTGDDAFSLEPSNWVLDRVDNAEVKDYYQFATKRVLDQMNHTNSGLSTAMKPYFYDQVAFGTSGIGAFKNSRYEAGIEENALIFSSYGIDNIAVDEGQNGKIDTVFVVWQWRVNRIVQEFAYDNERQVDAKKFKGLPKAIKDSWNSQNINKEFTVVQAIYPRENYHPTLKGKRGTKFIGEWFLDDADHRVFYTEDYKDMPIPICRAIKVRGEIYGRSSGTILISTIKSVNYMFSKAVEVIEKMASIPLGTFNGSLFGDSVLDTSADGLTVFNPAVSPGGGSPVFPLIDVGDPTALIAFLIPYLNDKITTGFKVDALLDFNSQKDMTATESLQRYAIRGRSLAGMLQQQKDEQFTPLIERSTNLLDDMGELGIEEELFPAFAKQLKALNKEDRIIPEIITEAKKAGKPWFKIKFNNELEKLTKTERLERIIQIINGLTIIAPLFPQILEGVEWYKLWQDVNSVLGEDYAISEDDFKEKIKAMAKQREQQMQIAAAQAGADIGKTMSETGKNKSDAQAQKV